MSTPLIVPAAGRASLRDIDDQCRFIEAGEVFVDKDEAKVGQSSLVRSWRRLGRQFEVELGRMELLSKVGGHVGGEVMYLNSVGILHVSGEGPR